MKTLYSNHFDDDGNLVIQEITVLEERIATGASIPTYVVRYPDGSKAQISTNMYSTSLSDAIADATAELSDAAICIEHQRAELAKDEAYLNKCSLSLLKHLEKQGG